VVCLIDYLPTFLELPNLHSIECKDGCRSSGSHGGGYEEFCRLLYNAKSTTVSEEHVASIFMVAE
jgi:hypothetical protein